MSQYKYYFKKAKSEIVKDIFSWLGTAGIIYIAASSPYFVSNLTKAFNQKKKYPKKKAYDAFYNLYRQGYLNIEKKNHRATVSLTEKGKRKAGRFQIDCLKINKPKKWDGKWRVVIFDIVSSQNIKRNVFRWKLEELGFKLIQRSVWCCPYPCQDEISLLRDFLGLSKKDICVMIVAKIENDRSLRKKFNLG